MTDKPQPPKHAIEVTITLGVHEWDEVGMYLRDLCWRFDKNGGELNWSMGAHCSVEVQTNPDMTKERHMKELDEYLRAVREIQ